MKIRALVTLSVAGLLILFSAIAYRAPSRVEAAEKTNTIVDARGNLRVPANYRTTYQFLGSWAIAADKGVQGSKQIHDVYASPGAIAAYRRDGRFPDGTVLSERGPRNGNPADDDRDCQPCRQIGGLVCDGEGKQKPPS